MRQRQKKNYDSHHRVQTLHPLSPGDTVWSPEQTTDRTVLQESGPQSYTTKHPMDYIIEIGATSSLSKHLV